MQQFFQSGYFLKITQAIENSALHVGHANAIRLFHYAVTDARSDITEGNIIKFKWSKTLATGNVNFIKHLIGATVVFKRRMVREARSLRDMRPYEISACHGLPCFHAYGDIHGCV